MYIYTNLNEITFSIFLSTQRFKLLSSDCSRNIYSRVTIRVTQLFVGLWAKFARKTGEGGRLKTICPEIFFNTLTGGCIFNPYKVFLWDRAIANIRQTKTNLAASLSAVFFNDLKNIRPRGPMDKASDYESGDSRFESWRGRFFFKTKVDV